MTFPIGKMKKNNNKSHAACSLGPRPSFVFLGKYGFTLLELMLVSVIILAMVAISTPLFRRTYEDLKLTTTVKDISMLMQFCREKAVFERRPYRISLDINQKTYQALVEEDDEEFKPLKSRWGRLFRIPGGIDIETSLEKIDFSPSGKPTPAVVYLTNNKNVTHTIFIESNTGRIRVYDYKKE
ncbi:MAG: prepilin-type N-terminal cleavage/methylation domain-containing protein [Candidatus Omnitrophota bacterium]